MISRTMKISLGEIRGTKIVNMYAHLMKKLNIVCPVKATPLATPNQARVGLRMEDNDVATRVNAEYRAHIFTSFDALLNNCQFSSIRGK